jgi:DNA-binding CsgD family transcriptional regulator
MNFLDTISDVCSLRGDDPCRRRPARRRWRAGRDHGVVTLDENSFVVDMNAAAQAILDDNVKIRDRRIVLRDAKSRGRLKEAIDSLHMTPRLNLIADRIIVPRIGKLPPILRIWPCSGETQGEAGAARFVITLNALGPKPGPPAPVLAKILGLTPAEARLACVMARGTPCNIAAQELNISRETARNQLKFIFSKTDTHRQCTLVALLLQVE